MAEEKPDAEQAETEQKPVRAGNKSLFLIIGIIVIALAGGAAAYVFLFSNKSGGEEHAPAHKGEAKEAKSALVAIEPFVMNLAEQGRFLKVSMQFELADATAQAMVTEKMPQLRDAIITLVSSKSADSLASPEGKFHLKDELLLRANQAMGKELFKNLYFTEFVMQ